MLKLTLRALAEAEWSASKASAAAPARTLVPLGVLEIRILRPVRAAAGRPLGKRGGGERNTVKQYITVHYGGQSPLWRLCVCVSLFCIFLPVDNST